MVGRVLGGARTTQARPISTRLLAITGLIIFGKPPPSGFIRRMPRRMLCWTWRAMSGNGVLIYMTIKPRNLAAMGRMMELEQFAAVPGTIRLAICAVRSASSTFPTIESLISAFGWSWALPCDFCFLSADFWFLLCCFLLLLFGYREAVAIFFHRSRRVDGTPSSSLASINPSHSLVSANPRPSRSLALRESEPRNSPVFAVSSLNFGSHIWQCTPQPNAQFAPKPRANEAASFIIVL